MSNNVEIPSILSFCRCINTTDALMHAKSWGGTKKTPIPVLEKTVRGVISNRIKKDSDLEKSIENPNIQRVDYAILPQDCDTLVISYRLQINKLSGPDACNDEGARVRIEEMIREYMESGRITDVACRYAANVANARWTWRNFVSAESAEVVVDRVVGGETVRTWTFDAFQIARDGFSDLSDDVKDLGQSFAEDLRNGSTGVYRVHGSLRLYPGAEVYPSQLFATSRSTKKGAKGKHLFAIDGVAAMSSQKIGNALRTIDTGETDTPIAVEPYGSVTSRGVAYRTRSKSFYHIFDRWVLRKETLPADQDYVMAMLIRGGVFGKKAE